MNENEVKTAFDRIEPESGAQERMYANILKKAAAQKAAAPEEKTDAPAAENDASATVVSLPVRRPTPMWKRCSAMAACLALVVTVTLGFLSPFLSRDSEANEPPVMVGSPRILNRSAFPSTHRRARKMSPTAFMTAPSPAWTSR